MKNLSLGNVAVWINISTFSSYIKYSVQETLLTTPLNICELLTFRYHFGARGGNIRGLSNVASERENFAVYTLEELRMEIWKKC